MLYVVGQIYKFDLQLLLRTLIMVTIYTHHLYTLSDSDNFLKSLSEYEISFFSENCFSVKNSDGLYLTAFPDEKIEFHAKKCSTWEKFYILDEEALFFIQESIAHSFKDNHNSIIKSYKPFLDKDKLHILLGSNVFTPSFIPPAQFIRSNNLLKYITLHNTITTSKSNPLIYFCIYGKDEYYECFYLALKSLISKGEYYGDILVKTDNIDKVKNFTKQFSNKFYYSEINKNLGIFNRYWLHEDCLSQYSSIIYFDSDILTIKNINNLLTNLSTEELVSFTDGNQNIDSVIDRFMKNTYSAAEWYGLQYLDKNKILQYNQILILNSGLYAINNLYKVKPIFDKIIQYKFLEDGHGDQPFFNLALYNSNITVKTLNEFNELIFSRSSYQSLSNLDKIVIHYNSGVGNISKLKLMQETWEYINNIE